MEKSGTNEKMEQPFFLWWNPAANFDKFFDFFFGETQPQLLKLKIGFELRCQTKSLKNWSNLSDEK